VRPPSALWHDGVHVEVDAEVGLVDVGEPLVAEDEEGDVELSCLPCLDPLRRLLARWLALQKCEPEGGVCGVYLLLYVLPGLGQVAKSAPSFWVRHSFGAANLPH